MVDLPELYQSDHEIIRDLDDAAMLHLMADENMQEWAWSGAVIIETVRAVRDFLRSGPDKVSAGADRTRTAAVRPSPPSSAGRWAAGQRSIHRAAVVPGGRCRLSKTASAKASNAGRCAASPASNTTTRE